MQLNTIKRTNTAILNARLLPIVADLIDQVKAMMAQRGLRVPLMIVKADGTLLSESAARKHPVETILSGPAASIWGALFLTGAQDALVVDIGGTTSDIALISGGKPAVSLSGATVGEWTTHVRAVDIVTLGLAGDSAVTLSRDGRLVLGPRRAVPLAVLGHEAPDIRKELDRLWEGREQRSSLVQPVEFFRSLRSPGSLALTPSEEKVLDALAQGSLSRRQLAETIAVVDPSMVPVSRLETLGIIQRATLTPTDVLHHRGIFTRWDRESARLGLRLVAHAARLDVEALADLVLETFTRRLTGHLINRVLARPGTPRPGPLEEQTLGDLALSGSSRRGLSLRFEYAHPLIAIGAPAYALGPAVAERLGTHLVVPQHAEVANAVGAVTGMQALAVEAVISPDADTFIVHSPVERRVFARLDEARQWTTAHVEALLEERIREEGQPGIPFHRETETRDAVGKTAGGEVYLESVVRATGVGKPSLV